MNRIIMKDIQSSSDVRNIPIKKVGIKDLKYPVVLIDKDNKKQPTTANISMYVNLPHHLKGTHMSRFVELLNKHHKEINLQNIDQILEEMTAKLESDIAYLEMSFTYFIEKIAPISKKASLIDLDCAIIAKYDKNTKKCDNILQVKTPVTSLCPCSKEISKYGAHNQRSIFTIQVRSSDFVSIEDLVNVAESSASAPLYALLKRGDEKHVTEQAYDNPAFVEDLVRNVAVVLQKDSRITWYKVESENFESIHNHSAYAVVESE